MDNVTHSLVGVVLAKTVKWSDSASKKAAIWSAVIASNLPDLDFVLKGGGAKDNLDYLLHHRGYTHTFLASIPLGLIATLIGIGLTRGKAVQRKRIFLLGVIASIFHIAADFCNNYGVHPLTPFVNKWFYGDFIFIIEPLLSFVLLSYAFWTSPSKLLKGLVGIATVLLLGVYWAIGSIHWTMSLVVSLWAFIFFVVQRKSVTVAPSVFGLISVLLLFWIGRVVVKNDVKTSVLTKSGVELHQLVTNPLPGNPICWSVVVLGTEGGSQYFAQTGTYSLLPNVFTQSSCSSFMDMNSTQLDKVTVQSDTKVHWLAEFRRPLKEFESLKKNNCKFQAFMRFSRVPIWFKDDKGFWAEDLRYRRSSQGGFTRINLDSSESCPEHVPSWEPPSLDRI